DGEWSFRHIGLITIEWVLMVLLGFVLASWCTLAILEDPVGRSGALEVLGGWASYLGLIIGAAGSWWLLRPHRYFAAIPWAIAAFFIVPILAATLHARDTAGQWWGYHTLT